MNDNAGRPASALRTGLHLGRWLLRILLSLLLLLAICWAALALWIDGPESRIVAGVLAGSLLIGTVVSAVLVRPFRRAAACVAVLFTLVLAWWLALTPSNDRNWQPDVARLPTATLDGSLLTIHNIRSFNYRDVDEYDERWITATYDLNELVGYDIFFSFWGPTAYGHTISSWEFADGRHLAISIETRKEVGESYSALRGFFRQFELYYVVAEETDVIKLRTNYRGERVELYRIYTPDNGAEKMLLNYVSDMNELATKPKWYNALTHNCTTTIWRHAKAVGSSFPLDWRLLANGYVLQLAYQLGTVNTSMSLEALQRASDITAKARQAGDDDDFSRQIRIGLPARPTQLPEWRRAES